MSDDAGDNKVIRDMRDRLEEMTRTIKAKDEALDDYKASAEAANKKLQELERAKLDEIERLKLELKDKTIEAEAYKVKAAEVEPLGKTLEETFTSRLNSIPEEHRTGIQEATEGLSWPQRMKVFDKMASLIPAQPAAAAPTKAGVFNQPTEQKRTVEGAKPMSPEELERADWGFKPFVPGNFSQTA